MGKQHKPKRLAVRNCICGRRPELNNIATVGYHPDRFQLKAGAICMLAVMAIAYIVEPWWVLVPPAILLCIALVSAIIKFFRGHTLACALRGGALIGVAAFANVLEVLNPGNWF